MLDDLQGPDHSNYDQTDRGNEHEFFSFTTWIFKNSRPEIRW